MKQKQFASQYPKVPMSRLSLCLEIFFPFSASVMQRRERREARSFCAPRALEIKEKLVTSRREGI
jgi:hypothetical protein